MSREIAEAASNAEKIDLDRVVIDPDYRREVLSQLRCDRLRHSDGEQPAAPMAAEGEKR